MNLLKAHRSESTTKVTSSSTGGPILKLKMRCTTAAATVAVEKAPKFGGQIRYPHDELLGLLTTSQDGFSGMGRDSATPLDADDDTNMGVNMSKFKS